MAAEAISDRLSEGDRPDPINDQEVEIGVTMLRALGHPTRFRMIDLIRRNGGELCVCELEAHFDLSQPTISHHLRILRESGVIRSRQDGTWVKHSIEQRGLETLMELLKVMSTDPTTV